MDEVTLDWSITGPDLQALLDSLPTGILHWDRRRSPFYVSNRAMRELMGAPADGPFPVRGSGFGGMVEADRNRIAEALRRGDAFDGVVTTATPGGTKRELHLRVQGNADLGWSLATLASEAPARFEQSVRRERFTPLFEHSLVAMFLLDHTGLVLTANPAAAKLLGRASVTELLSHRFDVRQFMPDDALRTALLDELGERGFVAGREVPLTRTDGSEAWVRLDLAVNPDDGFIEMVATDIDEERAATEALRDSERRYRGIFENAVVGVIQMTPECEILTANRYAARLFGYQSVEALARGWRGEHPTTCDELRQRIAELGAGQQESVSEHDVHSTGGTTRWVRVLQHLDVEAGIVDAFVVDITAQREAQAERERLIRELGLRATERRQLVRRLLSAGEEERRQVAHEIHDGPVQLLAGSLMFLTSAQQEREQKRTETADDYVERGTTYLRTALVELRRVMAHLRPAVLDDLGLTSAITSAGEAALAPYRMRVRVEELGAPGPLDAATEMVLFRVAQEATTNAGKHSHGTHVGVTLDYSDPERLRLVVSDDGEGFDSEAAFTSADGHHLGLLGLKERVDLVGGSFRIESSARGTAITVDVPRHADSGLDVGAD